MCYFDLVNFLFTSEWYLSDLILYKLDMSTYLTNLIILKLVLVITTVNKNKFKCIERLLYDI